MIHPQPKPIKRKTVKTKRAKHETSVKKSVREDCVDRDGFCRLFTYREDVYMLVGSCEGRSEWAHLWNKKRARTRGMPAEVRHTSDDSCQFCTRHHRAYDAGLFQLAAVTDKGANGQIRLSVYSPIAGERACLV